ncbi:MAG TPA: tetratricopeptide repeat protein [Bosea sp. (in: a-proteobacteria)]|uniref:tetratricopeptide repeat protein n=1 Tax=Bosea sp. (in: a-proteobacteria) TaxID=1871050 RepID=UPI002E1369FF|nr:tetratricopeptide repeat protein [Bosea sp. (in: a-proteobacteria)]
MPPVRDGHLPAANKQFVDREEPQRTFEKAAFSIPNDRAILRVFYGVGGQGKTALCRELVRKTRAADDPAYGHLRTAHIDLRNKPTDPDLLLVLIRNEFARAGIVMPCFDIALAIVWEGTRGEQPFPALVNPWLGRLTSGAKSAVDRGADKAGDWLGATGATELVGDVLDQIPGVGFLLKRIGHWAIDRGKRLYLARTRDHLQRLHRDGNLRPAHELSMLLPWMLAQDLNHHLVEHSRERFVLFVDEYERVFDQGGAGSRWVDNPFDRHLRTFIQETNGLLAVLFSRERLPWAEDPDWRADLADNQHLLGGLSDKDANDFLAAVPITDPLIRAAILEGARETAAPKAPVYPLMLDLQVEHWRSLTARNEVSPDRFDVSEETFEGRCRGMVGIVLRDYDPSLQATIDRLSAARRFDRAAFRHVVREFGTGLPLDRFERVTELSFVTTGADGFFSFHNAIATAIRELLGDERQTESAASLLAHFEERAGCEAGSTPSPENLAALIEAAHLHRGLDERGHVAWLEDATRALGPGSWRAEQAQLWRDGVTASEVANGPDHPATGRALGHLGVILHNMGDLAGARPLLERALAIFVATAGSEHPATALALNDLGSLMKDIGDYAGARPLCEQALAINEKVLGPDAPMTGRSVNDLGLLLHATGAYGEALVLLRRALALAEREHGPESAATGIALNNLGLVLRDMSDLAEARLLYERALRISERINGTDHPWTAVSLNNLGGVLQDLGDLATALPLMQRALAIGEQCDGADHPVTATALNNLGLLLRDMNDHDGARRLFERALGISEAVNGAGHPATGASLNNLGLVLWDIGKPAEALPVFERALAISEETEGPEHPSTAVRLNNLALVLRDLGDPARAQPFCERALRITEAANGAEHPFTGRMLDNFGILLEASGLRHQAGAAFERAARILDDTLGTAHHWTMRAQDNHRRLSENSTS